MQLRDEIAQQALALPQEDRAYVADLLEGSLDDAGDYDPELADAWTREIERRVEAFRRGESTAVDFDTAMREVREALERRRAARTGHS